MKLKKLAVLAIAGVMCVAGYALYPYVLQALFHVSGTVTVSERLAKRAAKPNTVCFVIVKNMGDVPVAIKRVVNPTFPLNFSVKHKDLILSDSWNQQLKVEVQINDHGKVGVLSAGDMFGSADDTIKLFAKDVVVNVDKMMGVPSLIASNTEPDKSAYIFRSAAR